MCQKKIQKKIEISKKKKLELVETETWKKKRDAFAYPDSNSHAHLHMQAMHIEFCRTLVSIALWWIWSKIEKFTKLTKNAKKYTFHLIPSHSLFHSNSHFYQSLSIVRTISKNSSILKRRDFLQTSLHILFNTD